MTTCGSEPFDRPGRGPARAARRLAGALAVLMIATTGCHSVGPPTVPRDRIDYSTAIAESWKRQTLLNIVKVRYMDTPIFVDVGQIVSGYSLETGATGAAVGFPYSPQDQFQIQGSTKFTDRPTITYVPLTGSRFIAGLMTPIPPDSVFSSIQSGWPADVLLRLVASSINGLRNEDSSVGGRGAPDAQFGRAVELLRAVQVSGALSFRVVKGKAAGEQASLLVFQRANVPPESADQMRELGTLLGLEPGLKEYKLVYGSVAADGKELAVLTRSLFHVIAAMALRAQVPEADVKEGRAVPGLPPLAEGAGSRRRPLIHCSPSAPADAYVAVRYRGHWFWIDDRDVLAKREFAFIMMLFTMADTGAERAPPVLTIPTQ